MCVCVFCWLCCVCACVRAVFVTLWLYSIVSIIFLYCLALITDSWSGAPKGPPRRAPRQGAERGHARADVGGECALHLARGPPGFPAAGEVLIARCTYTWLTRHRPLKDTLRRHHAARLRTDGENDARARRRWWRKQPRRGRCFNRCNTASAEMPRAHR